MIGYCAPVECRHEKGRSVSRAAFVGAGGLCHLDPLVLNLPTCVAAQALANQHAIPPDFDEVTHAERIPTVVALPEKLTARQALVWGVKDREAILRDFQIRDPRLMTDGVLGAKNARGVPSDLERTTFDLVEVLTYELNFGTDAHGVGGRAGSPIGWKPPARRGQRAPTKDIGRIGNRLKLNLSFLFCSRPLDGTAKCDYTLACRGGTSLLPPPLPVQGLIPPDTSSVHYLSSPPRTKKTPPLRGAHLAPLLLDTRIVLGVGVAQVSVPLLPCLLIGGIGVPEFSGGTAATAGSVFTHGSGSFLVGFLGAGFPLLPYSRQKREGL